MDLLTPPPLPRFGFVTLLRFFYLIFFCFFMAPSFLKILLTPPLIVLHFHFRYEILQGSNDNYQVSRATSPLPPAISFQKRCYASGAWEGGVHIYLLSNTVANQNEPDIVQMLVKFSFIMPPLN